MRWFLYDFKMQNILDFSVSAFLIAFDYILAVWKFIFVISIARVFLCCYESVLAVQGDPQDNIGEAKADGVWFTRKRP